MEMKRRQWVQGMLCRESHWDADGLSMRGGREAYVKSDLDFWS